MSGTTADISLKKPGRVRYTLVPAGFLLFWLVFISTARPDDPEPCLDCHPDMASRFEGEVVHEPYESENCYACHIYHGFSGQATLVDSVFNLCAGCHEFAHDLEADAGHYPVFEDASCLTCHRPHAADEPNLLLGKVPAICVDCHDAPEEAGETAHPPYAEGDCAVCHDPHGSLFPASLIMPAGYVCLDCHADVLTEGTPEEMHAADSESLKSCDQCHVGHSSDAEPLLVEEATPLCLTCHEDIQAQTQTEYEHPVVLDDGCLLCHDPHNRRLTDPELDLCGACHDTDDDDFAALHAGLKPQVCSECHNPHGSSRAKLLTESPHDPFSEGECDVCHETGQTRAELRDPEICLACHDVEPDHTGTAMPASEGACTACHSPHRIGN